MAADRLRSVLPADARVTLVCPLSGMGEEVRHRVITEREKWNIDWQDREFQDSDIIDEVSPRFLLQYHDAEVITRNGTWFSLRWTTRISASTSTV